MFRVLYSDVGWCFLPFYFRIQVVFSLSSPSPPMCTAQGAEEKYRTYFLFVRVAVCVSK